MSGLWFGIGGRLVMRTPVGEIQLSPVGEIQLFRHYCKIRLLVRASRRTDTESWSAALGLLPSALPKNVVVSWLPKRLQLDCNPQTVRVCMLDRLAEADGPLPQRQRLPLGTENPPRDRSRKCVA